MKLDFSKGIHTDSKPINTPKGYYSDALNMRSSGASKRSEEGNVQMPVPTDFIQWGSCAIGDETILLGTKAGKSIIGSLDIDDNWTQLIYRTGVDILGIVAETQVEGKKNWAGERVIYFATPSGARRINLDQTIPAGDSDFDKITSLFLEYDLPQVSYAGESNNGTLGSGVYQIFARLVTESGASTSFGIGTNPIPIVQSSLQSSRQDIVGNPPQTVTSKSIEIELNNIDTAFKYVQLGILTYVGAANVPKTTVTNLITVNGQSSLSYTYTGEQDDLETILPGELIASGVAYSTGKYFAQKDGSLLIGSPEEADLPPIDWFRVAQGITSKYIIKELSYQENLQFDAKDLTDVDNYSLRETSENPVDQGYANPITCELYKGYRRDEVYALTLTPVFTSGVQGPTVHIPANHSIDTAASGGTLGTFISEETYPDDRYTGLLGSGLRLHKMPTAIEEPIISGNVTTNDAKMRVLGIRLENIVLDASETQYSSQIAGFIIGRVNRKGNETQLAQGIVRPHTNVQWLQDADYSRSTYLGDGFVSWSTTTRDNTANMTNTPTGTPDLADFNFIAPDLIHNLYSPATASHIKQHSIYSADPYKAPVHDSEWRRRTDINLYSLPRVFFKNIEGISATSISQAETELDGNKVDVQPFGVPLAPFNEGGQRETTILKGSKSIKMGSSDGFVWMSSLGGVNITYHRDYQAYYESHAYLGNNDAEQSRIGMRNLLALGTKVEFVLHTLTRKDAKQYGPLNQMSSMFAHYETWASSGGVVEFFNGDTFISKYGLTINDEANFPYTLESGTAFTGEMHPAPASGVVYFFLESSNNYNYRHYIQPTSFTEDNISQGNGSTPFFPAYKQLMNQQTPFGILSMKSPNFTRPGYASQYNNQYSAQPTLKPYVITPPEDIDRRASLVNRIIYSDQAVQGEKSDAYQIFLPNNYYDVPQQFGELTDVYVNHELFASTAQVQWQLFFNTLATQITSAGEVVLGTGGAFNRPAIPMQTMEGGYGGNTHWTHAVNTVFGRVILDKRQGKLFKLTDRLTHISEDWDDTDRLTIQELNDNNIKLGSEPLRERVLIRLDRDLWSYDLSTDLFISRHNWYPGWFFTHGPYMYTNNPTSYFGDTGIFKHGVGLTGMFYGRLYKSNITLVANEGNDLSKLFMNLELVTRKTTEAGLNLPFTTFDSLEVWNDERYSGKLSIVPKTSAFQAPGILEVLSSKVKDSFRMDVPRDIVINPNSSIFDVSNHKQNSSDTVPAKWLPKMRGNFVEIKLETDNNDGPLYIFSANVGVSENIR